MVQTEPLHIPGALSAPQADRDVLEDSGGTAWPGLSSTNQIYLALAMSTWVSTQMKTLLYPQDRELLMLSKTQP